MFGPQRNRNVYYFLLIDVDIDYSAVRLLPPCLFSACVISRSFGHLISDCHSSCFETYISYYVDLCQLTFTLVTLLLLNVDSRQTF